MRYTGEALGRNLGGYLGADWEHRPPENKGARCVRYFGHWSQTARVKGGRRKIAPYGSRFGWMHPRARVWREMVKQAAIVFELQGRVHCRREHH